MNADQPQVQTDDAAALPAQPEAVQGRDASRLHALKDGDTFVVADAFGDIYGDGDGMFHNDTRVLSSCG